VSAHECPLAFYNSARAEIVARITQRDTTLLAYLVSVGDELVRNRLVLTIGCLSAAAAFLVAQHHEVIGELSLYVRRLQDSFVQAPQCWDASDDLLRAMPRSLGNRNVAHIVIVCGPAIPSLWTTFWSFARFWDSPTQETAAWYASLACVVAAAWILLRAHHYRQDLLEHGKIQDPKALRPAKDGSSNELPGDDRRN
jgi:hypothetical protein